MLSFDEICYRAYNSVEQEDGLWTYATFKSSKRPPKKKENKLGLRVLDRRRRYEK